jgi:hypothetical protein
MNTNGNGTHRSAPPSDWEAHADEIQKVQDPQVREVLLLGLERDREAWQQRSIYARHFEEHRATVAEQFVMLLGSAARTEQRLDYVCAILDPMSLRVAWLDNEATLADDHRKETNEDLTELDLKVEQTRSRLESSAKSAATSRARMDERIRQLEAEQSRLRGDVTTTGQRAAVAEDRAGEALERASQVDEVERRERVKHRWWVRKRKVLFAAAVGLALVGGTVKAGVWWIEHVAVKAAERR